MVDRKEEFLSRGRLKSLSTLLLVKLSQLSSKALYYADGQAPS